jgi:hypothetical protein
MAKGKKEKSVTIIRFDMCYPFLSLNNVVVFSAIGAIDIIVTLLIITILILIQ